MDKNEVFHNFICIYLCIDCNSNLICFCYVTTNYQIKIHNFKKKFLTAGKRLENRTNTTGLTGCLSGLTGMYHDLVLGLTRLLS